MSKVLDNGIPLALGAAAAFVVAAFFERARSAGARPRDGASQGYEAKMERIRDHLNASSGGDVYRFERTVPGSIMDKSNNILLFRDRSSVVVVYRFSENGRVVERWIGKFPLDTLEEIESAVGDAYGIELRRRASRGSRNPNRFDRGLSA